MRVLLCVKGLGAISGGWPVFIQSVEVNGGIVRFVEGRGHLVVKRDSFNHASGARGL